MKKNVESLLELWNGFAHENVADCSFFNVGKFDIRLTLYNLGLKGKNGSLYALTVRKKYSGGVNKTTL